MARRNARTWDQIERMKEKAVRFVRNVLGDGERAEEIKDEPLESYAERRRITVLANPVIAILHRRIDMPAEVTKAELEKVLDQIEDLADEALDPELSREELVAKVKAIAELASSEEEEEGGEAEEGEEEEER